jgi:hypothetical protein
MMTAPITRSIGAVIWLLDTYFYRWFIRSDKKVSGINNQTDNFSSYFGQTNNSTEFYGGCTGCTGFTGSSGLSSPFGSSQFLGGSGSDNYGLYTTIGPSVQQSEEKKEKPIRFDIDSERIIVLD